MRLLLDSNVLLWSLSDRKKLTPRVRELIDDPQNEFFISRTSIWELSATVAAGRLQIPGSTIQSLIDQIEIAELTVLELEDRYILRTETLPYHHSDPSDRILIAQALEDGLIILSSDSNSNLGCAAIWNKATAGCRIHRSAPKPCQPPNPKINLNSNKSDHFHAKDFVLVTSPDRYTRQRENPRARLPAGLSHVAVL